MCLKKILYMLALSAMTCSAQASAIAAGDTLCLSDKARVEKKQPWIAAGKVIAINTGVWAFNRFITHEDFADISGKTIINNIKKGFVWDNDQFSTNLFAHPYHGNLYFNAARTSGLNFWESVPYALSGSLLWEIVEEAEPPAINDLIATTVGGIALGEVTNRISLLVLDDSKRGFNRFLREFAGTLISPMRGIKRLIYGDMWRVKSCGKYHDFEALPVKIAVSLGCRYLAEDNHLFKGEYNPFFEFGLRYGDPYNVKMNRPYDYFTFNAAFGLSANQPLISRINLLGKLWSTSWVNEDGMDLSFGVFQHFNYFDSEEVIDGSGRIPYKISEAASLGTGLMYRLPEVNRSIGLEQSAHVSGILLGGSLSEYYNVINRNYNMGSGYSIKSKTLLNFGKYGQFQFNVHLYQIFTWKGYENKDLANEDPLYLNAQGDKGNVMLAIMNPALQLNITDHLKANIESSYYWRYTHYKYHEDVRYKTFEAKLGLVYEF